MAVKSMTRNEEREESINDRNNRRENKARRRRNREFTLVAYFFLILFLALVGYITYFQVVKAEDVINNAYNKRQKLMAEKVIRGDIKTSNGKVIATTRVKGDKEVRYYPEGKKYAHAVGYSTNGTTGIEEFCNFELLRTHSFIGTQLVNTLSGNKSMGDTVVTTIDSKLQDVCYSSLSGYEGAIICIDPSTGKILSMISKPDYDPNMIKDNYESIIGNGDDNNSVLLNRTTQGAYTPGSTFKIFTTLEYLKENGADKDIDFTCTGSLTRNGSSIHCYGGETHGHINLEKAFAESCNCAYADIGLSLNINSFRELTKKLLFNKELPTDYPSVKSNFSLTRESSTDSIMQGSIGQDKITVSPMHMALVASAIANKGVLMNPYVVDRIENDTGMIVKENEESEYGRLISREEARVMRKLMKGTTSYGTAGALNSDNYKAYGKTGSAEVSDSSDDTHSWFVGFATKGKKKIAIAVIVEKQGNGSKYAVPIAKKVFDAYF